MLISYVDDGGASTQGTARFPPRFIGIALRMTREKIVMKQIVIGVSALAMAAFAVPALAQVYVPSPSVNVYYGQITPEMMDNGSSSDFPTHTPSDFVANQLNREVLMNNNTIEIYPVPMPVWIPVR